MPKGDSLVFRDFNKPSDGSSSTSSSGANADEADSKEGVLGSGKSSTEGEGVCDKGADEREFSSDSCKIQELRQGLLFLDDSKNSDLFFCGGGSSSTTQKPRRCADYIPRDLVSAVECPVCFNVLDAPVAFPCRGGHLLCSGCVRELIDLSIGTTAGRVGSHVPVRCPVCSEAAQAPVKAADFETFFKKVDMDPKAAEFVARLASDGCSSSSSSSLSNCPKHGSELVSYSIGLGAPLCSECIVERGSDADVTLPVKSCTSVVRHTTDILLSAALEFEDRCEGCVDVLDQVSALLKQSSRDVESDINAEAEFLHSIINKKRTSLIYNAHKIGKQRCKKMISYICTHKFHTNTNKFHYKYKHISLQIHINFIHMHT